MGSGCVLMRSNSFIWVANMHLPLQRFVPNSLSPSTETPIRLAKLDNFGSNPGNLKAWCYTPRSEAAATKLPLVVVLHGCTQTAAGYDRGSGWSELASTYGFATLFPEQQRSNNPNLCFNWFEPGDTRRAAGEALSIAQMIEAMIEVHGIDRERVYITGLSAGGAMTSVMLATYPEMFAGGAIIAGLPHGAATNVPEALQQMRAHSPSSRTAGGSIRAASPHRGPWPTISVWHGTADTVVSPSNADAILRQWRDIHGASDVPDEKGLVGRHPRRVWRNESGKTLIEEYRVAGMGHGTPLATDGADGYGQAGPFMLEMGISSTLQSAKTWGLLDHRLNTVSVRNEIQPWSSNRASGGAAEVAPTGGDTNYISSVIEGALRTAGLLK